MSNLCDKIIWPSDFANNTLDFSDSEPRLVLAMQLCAWGNVMLGCPPPTNFFEVMDAASKVTSAFTPDQCMVRSINLF